MGFFDKIFGKNKDQVGAKGANITIGADQLAAVLDGVLKPITESEDPVFSQKLMGDGYLIEPTGNIVVSPVNGIVQTVFPTKHALGITSDSGHEVIIHVGLDTVKLNGEGFTAFVQAGDKVVVGQKLLEVDFDLIKSKVPSIATPVVVSNIGDGKVELLSDATVKAGEIVAKISQ
ncbi:MAG: PTS sugar transporter subunit IIA [Culicoidibacterales bacterium]